ncbi:MAG: glycoside hydrolase family 3 N-terminal domain-containing protein [Gemmatimonadota bacterium]|nr:glycoside hydrolase family 3 N-terminal domain-containing protein [Gemmatimonadota bacterium]
MSKEHSESDPCLSLEQKIGLMIWAPFYGCRKWYESREFLRQREMLRKGLIGGVVITGGELYETATQVYDMQQNLELPLVVAAEVENGLGSLLREGTHFPANMAFGATRSGEYGFLAGKITAREAGAVGINLVFGPTCSRPGAGLPEGLPKVRSYGEKLHLVTRLSLAFFKGVQDGGAKSAPRYFPGAAILHTGEISGPKWLHHMRKLLVDTELSIYEMLTQSSMEALVVDWREIPDLETGKPVLSFTNRHLLEIFLREVVDYNGIIISPNLSDKVHAGRLLDKDILVSAVSAGVDVLAGAPEPDMVLRTLCDAVVQEKIPLSRIDKACGRIIEFRKKLKRTNPGAFRPEEIDKLVANPANLEVADRVAEDSITLLRDKKGYLPLDPAEHRTLLNLSFTAKFELAMDKYLDEALRNTFDRVITRQIDSLVSPSRLDEAWEETRNAGVILCAMFTNLPPEFSAHGFSPTQVEFIQSLIQEETPLIMASFGDPRTITLFPDIDCYICLYSDCPASQRALVSELFGDIVMPVKGKLPINLDTNLPYGFGLDLTS